MSCSFTTCPKVAREKEAMRGKPNKDERENQIIRTLL